MRFGLPRDPAQWLALALCAAALLTSALATRRARSPAPHPMQASGRGAACAIAAALLSAAYVAVYLRGGPRIIDATSYWLEARALAEGRLAWPLDEPVTSVLGRFLVRSDGAGPASTVAPRVAVLFPPGYPALLALGFLAGAPLAVGPLLAAALVLATWDLAARFDLRFDVHFDVAARRSAGRSARPGPGAAPAFPLVPALAALFSALCAALRYHTADTMSHGLAALCFTVALSSALRARDRAASGGAPGLAAVTAGVAAGWLTATRPPSGLALAATLVFLLCRGARCAGLPGAQGAGLPGAAGPGSPAAHLRIAALMALGALPGLALLAAHQRAATGAWASSQAAYYAVSDGPPGCFRYGFGGGIGCLGEHGDFVRHNLADGYGFLAAAGTTLRRLKLHLVDPLNAEPFAALVIAGAVLALRRPGARVLAIAPLLQIAAYAPFYFDGNYPGGGARFFADVLPVEHVLAAFAVAALAGARPPGAPPAGAWLAAAAALPLAGFALRAGFDHALLRDRDGGAPMFDPGVLARAGVTRGLVFVDTDHGFNLGYDPGPAPVQLARYHGDALDRMAWEARGRPPAYRYRFALPDGGGADAVPSVTPLFLDVPALRPREDVREDVIEGESLWPPLAQRDGWASPEHAGGTCASAGRLLVVHAATPGDAIVRVDLPAPWLRGAGVSPRIATKGRVSGAIHLVVDGVDAHVWRIAPGARQGNDAPLTCVALAPHRVVDGASRVELTLVRDRDRLDGEARGGLTHVDALRPNEPPAIEGEKSTVGALFALDALSVVGGKSVDR